MAKQKKLRENTNSNKTTDRKNINKAKPKKAGTVIAVYRLCKIFLYLKHFGIPGYVRLFRLFR